MNKMFLLSVGLMASALNVNAIPHGERPPLGINAAKEHCHFNTEDDSFSHMGPAASKGVTSKRVRLDSTSKGVDKQRHKQRGQTLILLT